MNTRANKLYGFILLRFRNSQYSSTNYNMQCGRKFFLSGSLNGLNQIDSNSIYKLDTSVGTEKSFKIKRWDISHCRPKPKLGESKPLYVCDLPSLSSNSIKTYKPILWLGLMLSALFPYQKMPLSLCLHVRQVQKTVLRQVPPIYKQKIFQVNLAQQDKKERKGMSV